MIIFLIIVAAYLVGCVLAYGRCLACFYELDEDYPEFRPEPDAFPAMIAVTSWIGFASGVLKYVKDDEKYFFKWSKQPLFDAYDARTEPIAVLFDK